MKIKRLNYFLSLDDEEKLSLDLRSEFPDIIFLDNNQWTTREPQVCNGIHLCKFHYVYLWNKALFPELPIMHLENGLFQGPSTRQVVQFQRNRIKENFMQSAQLSISYDENNEDEKRFSERIYKIIKKQHSSPLNVLDQETNTVIESNINRVIVGRNAAERARNELCLTLAFGQTHIFRPT